MKLAGGSYLTAWSTYGDLDEVCARRAACCWHADTEPLRSLGRVAFAAPTCTSCPGDRLAAGLRRAPRTDRRRLGRDTDRPAVDDARRSPRSRPRPGTPSRPGVFEFSRYENCCLPGASCLWNNPSHARTGPTRSRRRPGQTVPDPTCAPTASSRNFHLRAGRGAGLPRADPAAVAVLLVAELPHFREEPTGTELGDRQPRPLAEPSGGRRAARRGRAVRRPVRDCDHDGRRGRGAGGGPGSSPPGGTRPTSTRTGSRSSSSARASTPTTTCSALSRGSRCTTTLAAGEAWLDDPGAVVLRLTPATRGSRGRERTRWQPVPERGTGADRGGLASRRPTGWRLAIRAAYPTFAAGRAGERGPGTTRPTPASSRTRTARARSATATTRGCRTSCLPGDGSFAVAFGREPRADRQGVATRTSSVETVENQIGLEAVESDRFLGSARAFLPDDPQVDDLYAVMVARRLRRVRRPAVHRGPDRAARGSTSRTRC